jgi:hypothetical protein
VCLETLHIGRATADTVNRRALLATQNQTLFGADRNRRVIIIGPPSAGNLWVGPLEMTGNGQGFIIASTSTFLQFNVEEHGDVVTRAWFAWPSVAATVLWVEGSLYESRLKWAGIVESQEEFRVGIR